MNNELKETIEKIVKEATEAIQKVVENADGSKDEWYLSDKCHEVYTIRTGEWPSETKVERWHGSGNQYECFGDWAKIGNLFKTKEEAEKAVEWLKAFKTIRDDAKGYEFVPDEASYGVVYRTDVESFIVDDDYTYRRAGVIYFKTKEDAQASIDKHAKEWKIFLGISD